ncbi:MAG: hypothetical protein E3J81_09015 [Dehalococcoidia bacterium]|nr:MAG: hypothetical protein E3J81_09015 [Dehalococcoidia bacterium]
MGTYNSVEELKAMVKAKFEQAGLGHLWPVIERIVTLETAGTWNPAIQSGAIDPATGTYEDSWGLFQMYRTAGLGTGYSVEQLQDPEFNTDLAVKHIKAEIARGAPTAEALDDWTTSPRALQEVGGEMAQTVDRTLQERITGAPKGDVPLDFEEFWNSLGPDQQTMLQTYLLPEVARAIAPTVTTTQQTYDVQDAQAQRDLDRYVAQVAEGKMPLEQALVEISREQAVTSRTEAMGQEQRAFWDMQLAPGTEYQPGFGPEGAIGALQQERGAEFQPRPVTTVPTGALSAQANLQQAQQTIPQVPPMDMPQYPQLPPPSGMGPTQTTTTGSGFADDILKILGMGGQQATPGGDVVNYLPPGYNPQYGWIFRE